MVETPTKTDILCFIIKLQTVAASNRVNNILVDSA